MHEVDTSQSEGAVLFRSMLEQIGETESSLAKFMQDMGDDRSDSTILRGIQRVSSGEARFSGEMRVLMNLIRALRRRIAGVSMKSDWVEDSAGCVEGVTADGFRIKLTPESKGRWSAYIVHEPSGYCPPYPRWQYSLLGAKEAAMRRVEQARSDDEWERGDDLVFVSMSSDDSYVIWSWMRGLTFNVSKNIDEENSERALEIIQKSFDKQGLVLDAAKFGKLSFDSIRFRLGPCDGVSGISVPIAYFKNVPKNVKRLPASAFNS